MKLGVVSDVHGNVEALERALAALEPAVDMILLAGDAMHEYRFCNEVVEAARRYEMGYVLGNHELSLLGPGGERARSGPGVRRENLDFLSTVPTRWEKTLGGRRIGMVHGSPWEPHSEYLLAGNETLRRAGELGLDILILGHTHVPMVMRVGGTLVVNPGSLGESREVSARELVSYAVIDTADTHAEIHRFANPRLTTVRPSAT